MFSWEGAEVVPTVSAIIPTYNRVRYLREAVESVRAQTCRDWELIVVDDGSTDGTADYLTSVNDVRLRIQPTEHCANPGKLRNLAARLASGRYLAFLDSDDVWEPRKLELQVGMLRRYPVCRWSFGAYALISATGGSVPLPNLRTRGPLVGRVLADLIEPRNPCATPTVIVERGLFDEVGGFDESIWRCEDYDLWLRLAARSPACIVGDPIARIRLHPTSLPVQPGEVDQWWTRICIKLAECADDASIRHLCHRECASRTVSRFAKVYAATRSPVAAVRAFRDSLHGQRLSFRWWIAFGKALGSRIASAVRTRVRRFPRLP